LRTLNSDPDQAIVKNGFNVSIDEIFLFALVVMSLPAFFMLLCCKVFTAIFRRDCCPLA
jgi:hypothetical protein